MEIGTLHIVLRESQASSEILTHYELASQHLDPFKPIAEA